MRSILKYFLPERDFSWPQLEKMSAMVPGKATWPQQMLINLKQMGFDVVMVEGFDGRDFIKRGAQYLIDTFGEDVAAWQIEHSDIPQEQKLYQKMYDAGIRCEHRTASLDEMASYLDKGSLLQCIVNARSLNGTLGYVGHSVVVYGIDNEHITLHDPGAPSHEAWRITRAEFEKAWADPGESAKNFIAIKYSGTDRGAE